MAGWIQTIAAIKPTTTVVFVTHKTNLLGLADKILFLQNGQVAQFGDTAAVLSALMEASNRAAAAAAPVKADAPS